jgi:hypothetical protein
VPGTKRVTVPNIIKLSSVIRMLLDPSTNFLEPPLAHALGIYDTSGGVVRVMQPAPTRQAASKATAGTATFDQLSSTSRVPFPQPVHTSPTGGAQMVDEVRW